MAVLAANQSTDWQARSGLEHCFRGYEMDGKCALQHAKQRGATGYKEFSAACILQATFHQMLSMCNANPDAISKARAIVYASSCQRGMLDL